MTSSFSTTVRQVLPQRIRVALGSFWGNFTHGVLEPLQGFLFDLSGGRFKADGCVFEIPKSLTTQAYRACFWNGSYESEERELIRANLRADDQVMELGACLGIVSCVTNRLLDSESHHLVVEGNPKLIPWIERNRLLNQANFTVEHGAVSLDREVTFYLHPEFIVGGSSQRQTELPVVVPGCSLEELDKRHGPFNVMIMDIEGSELDVLQPAEPMLTRYRLVIIELHEWAIGDEGVERCRAILTRSGLKMVARVGRTEAWRRD